LSLNFLNKLLTNNRLWITLSTIFLILLLSPLFASDGVFYVPIFDNLDSSVVWYKILANSGLVFADNNTTIPNMMSGLPRSSYFSEFRILVLLYYLFEPQTAFIINEVSIHLLAFFSMFVFLKKYILKEKTYYKNIPVYVASLYFALIPYWTGSGASIALIPLITYTLLNIKNNDYTKFDWLIIILLPLYSSFTFFYMFYIFMVSLYIIFDSIRNRHINKKLLFAIGLMTIAFLLTEYRLVYAMFFNTSFISHRSEFDIFFNKPFAEVYTLALIFFLKGHISHISGLQVPYILPSIIISMVLTFVPRRFTAKESMAIWLIIILTFIAEIWNEILTKPYSLPLLTIFTLFFIIRQKKYTFFALLFLLQIILAFVASMDHYIALKGITDIFPILTKLNITRIAFIQPFIWSILLFLSILIYIKKLHFANIFVLILILVQFTHSYNKSFYQSKPTKKYASFKNYYAPELFAKIKEKIPEPIEEVRIVSYGLEPAVSLYNGFYTVDGYSPNYPLEYKYMFRKVIAEFLDIPSYQMARNTYDKWGGKIYILSTTVTPEYYKKDTIVKKSIFNVKALCELNTNYMISSRRFDPKSRPKLFLINKFVGKSDSWDIYLYKLKCD